MTEIKTSARNQRSRIRKGNKNLVITGLKINDKSRKKMKRKMEQFSNEHFNKNM